MNGRITNNLRQAIATMRRACDDADRRAESGDHYAVQQVLHALSWGMANASSSIQCAMAAVEDRHAEEIYKRDSAAIARAEGQADTQGAG